MRAARPGMLILLAMLVLTSCNETTEPPVIAIDTVLIPDESTPDEVILTARIRNAGNRPIVISGGCGLVGFDVLGPDGTRLNLENPCVAAIVDCPHLEHRLDPGETYEDTYPFRGSQWVVHPLDEFFECESVAVPSGTYETRIQFSYHRDGVDEYYWFRSELTPFTWKEPTP